MSIGVTPGTDDLDRCLRGLRSAADDASACLNEALRDGARQRALEMLEPVFTLLRTAQDKDPKEIKQELFTAAFQLRVFVRECLGGTREFSEKSWEAINEALSLSLNSASL